MKITKFEFSLSGLIIGLICVAFLASSLSIFMTQMESEHGLSGENNLAKYNSTGEIISSTEDIRDATDIQQEQGVLDVIGGYFTAGYSAIKVAAKSFSLFGNLMDEASNDIEVLSFFKSYIVAIVLIGIFLGIAVAVLVKMRI